MREGIGQTFLFSLVITIVGIMLVILISTMVYSKTYKIKTKLIDIIDKYNGDVDSARTEIQDYLIDIGYRRNSNNNQSCPEKGGEKLNEYDIFHYCLYRFSADSTGNKGNYYGVLVYIYFDIPFIGNAIEFPVYGETEVFYDKNYIGG